MPEPKTMDTEEAVVRHYLTALDDGRVVDALNAFSMDAELRDENGHERRGIREIAAAFASQEHPVRVEIEELEKKGEAVAVRLRLTFPATDEPRVYRSLFRVSRERIRSLIMDPAPVRPSRGRRLGRSA